MKLTKWTPARDVFSLRRDIDKLFEGMLEGSETSYLNNNWTVPVDIHESDNAYTFTADLPGLTKEEIKLSTHDNVLSLSGVRELERENENKNFHRFERFSGSFERFFHLPPSADIENIKASYDNGVLTITIPKRKEAIRKEIEISVD